MAIPTRRPRTFSTPWGAVALSRGRRGAVRIRGDHVRARDWGLGWAHAHDRPLQMTILRIAARGRAAECLRGNEAMVAQDRYLRERRFVDGAGRELAALDPATEEQLQAYCAGINAAQARPGQPVVLAALGVDEEPWTPQDVLLMLRLFAYLSLTQSQEITERFLINAWMTGSAQDADTLRRVYAPGLDGFDPGWLRGDDGGAPLTVEPTPLRFDPLCAAAMPHFSASNAWAVAGRRTRSGHALLAADPHLEVQSLPPTFYEVAMGGPDGWAVGVGVPGVPGVLAGRFPHVAVGVTYGFLDQVDFFVEDCRDGAVRRGNRWVPAARHDQTLRVKGGDDEVVTTWRSDRGILEGDPNVAGRYLCRAWTADVAPLAAALSVHERLWAARDLDEALEITATMPLSINYVLADTGGRIGLQQAGLAPDRAPGHTGLAPAPAWDATTAWRGILPPSALARIDATDRGWIATTNDPVNPPKRRLVNAGIAGYRRERLDQLLAGARRFEPEHFRGMQADVTSVRAARFMAALRPHLPDTAAGRLLAGWDHRFDADSQGATLFERTRAAWTRAAFGPLFDRARLLCRPTEAAEVVGLRPDEDFDRLWLESNPHVVHGRGWDDALLDPEHPLWAGRDYARVRDEALAEGLARPAVPWRQAQRLLRSWLLLDGTAFARLGAEQKMRPLIGSPETIHQGRTLRSGGRVAAFAPVWRMIADLGAPGLDCMLDGGPTDQPGRRWYRAGAGPFSRLELERLLPPD